MARKPILDRIEIRHRLLATIRAAGSYKAACDLEGISDKTFQRYREANPEFEAACQDAKAHYRVMYTLRMGGLVREKALKLLEKRIDEEEISDFALLKVIYDTTYGDNF